VSPLTTAIVVDGAVFDVVEFAGTTDTAEVNLGAIVVVVVVLVVVVIGAAFTGAMEVVS
jgi:hypothetical protein